MLYPLSASPTPHLSSLHDSFYAMEIVTITWKDWTHGFSCNPLRLPLFSVTSTENEPILYSFIPRESPTTSGIARMSPGTNLATDLQPTWGSTLEPQGRSFFKQNIFMTKRPQTPPTVKPNACSCLCPSNQELSLTSLWADTFPARLPLDSIAPS